MKLASMLRRLRNTRGGGARSAARSRSTPYTPYTNGPFGPVAHAGSDQTVSVKTKVYFDGSGSTDPDGGNLYYSWAFGAGAKPATGRGVKPSCTYTTTGDKTVTLTVRDTDNNVASDDVIINVREPLMPPEPEPPAAPGAVPNPTESPSVPLPVARITGDSIVSVRTEVTFDGSTSTGRNLMYSWNLGDGATDIEDADGPTPSCTYTTTGEKAVTLTVIDDRSVESETATLKVRVISMDSQTVEDGESPVFSVLGPSSVLEADTTTFSWGWSVSNLAQCGNDPAVVFLHPEPTAPPTHTTTIDRAKWYAFPNVTCSPRPSPPPDPFITSTYTIRCTVTTSNGSATVEAELSVTIPEEGGRTLSPTLSFNFDNDSGDSQMPWRLNPSSIRREDAEFIINVDKNSQFYDKLLAHEKRHVEQWKSGWKSNYFTADKFLNFVTNSGVTVRNLKSDIVENETNDAGEVVREGLRTLVGRAYRNWYVEEFNAVTRQFAVPGLLQAAERDAYSVSDQVSPHYYYEGVCRGY